MRTQYLSQSFMTTYCSAQKRSNWGLFLCRIIFTFMMSVRELGSKLWTLALGFCRDPKWVIYHYTLQHRKRTYFRGLRSKWLGGGWKSCWLSSLPSVVSHSGDSPRRCAIATPVLWGGHGSGRAELPLEGKADARPAETPGSASSTFVLLGFLSPVLGQPKSLEWGLRTGVLHACLKFSLSVIRVTDLGFFFLVIYVWV